MNKILIKQDFIEFYLVPERKLKNFNRGIY